MTAKLLVEEVTKLSGDCSHALSCKRRRFLSILSTCCQEGKESLARDRLKRSGDKVNNKRWLSQNQSMKDAIASGKEKKTSVNVDPPGHYNNST